MTECWRLDDFKKDDWVGIHYQEPEREFYDFPTVITNIINRKGELQDIVEVTHTPRRVSKKIEKNLYIKNLAYC